MLLKLPVENCWESGMGAMAPLASRPGSCFLICYMKAYIGGGIRNTSCTWIQSQGGFGRSGFGIRQTTDAHNPNVGWLLGSPNAYGDQSPNVREGLFMSWRVARSSRARAIRLWHVSSRSNFEETDRLCDTQHMKFFQQILCLLLYWHLHLETSF